MDLFLVSSAYEPLWPAYSQCHLVIYFCGFSLGRLRTLWMRFMVFPVWTWITRRADVIVGLGLHTPPTLPWRLASLISCRKCARTFTRCRILDRFNTGPMRLIPLSSLLLHGLFSVGHRLLHLRIKLGQYLTMLRWHPWEPPFVCMRQLASMAGFNCFWSDWLPHSPFKAWVLSLWLSVGISVVSSMECCPLVLIFTLQTDMHLAVLPGGKWKRKKRSSWPKSLTLIRMHFCTLLGEMICRPSVILWD